MYNWLTNTFSAVCVRPRECFQSASAFDDKPDQAFYLLLADGRIHTRKFQALQAANARVTDYRWSFIEELLPDFVVQQINIDIWL